MSSLNRKQQHPVLSSVRAWSAAALCCYAGVASSDAKEAYGGAHILLKMSSVAGKALPGAGVQRLHERYGVVSATPLLKTIGRRLETAKSTVGTDQSSTAAATDLNRWHAVEFSGSIDPAIVSGAYAKLDAVEAAQPNYVRRFCAEPDDPLYPQQSNLRAIGVGELPAGGARGIIVAVVDSGVDYLHGDLASQVWINTAESTGEAGVDDDANGYIDDIRGWDFTDAPGQAGNGDFLGRDDDPMDESGHGTHVAGIVGAVVDNGIGIAGLAPGVQLMVLRAGFQVGSAGFLEDDDVAAAIVYAVDNGAHIINLSLGDPSFSPLLRDVVRYANDAGVLVVAAAGNEGNGDVFFPARLDHTVAVAAVDDFGRIATFSNWGSSVDIAAPGIAILSLSPGNTYVERSGTSMSTAHVSGAAALVLARWPHLNPEQLRSALMHEALDIGSPGWDTRTGAGLLQASAASSSSPLTIQVEVGASTAEDSVEVGVTLMGDGAVTYTLSWGYGASPEQWTTFVNQRLVIEPGTRTVLREILSTAALPDSSYVIRAEVVSASTSHSDHSSLELRRAEPTVQSVQSGRALEGDHWDYWIEWQTAVPSRGLVEVYGEDEGLLFELPAPQRRSMHRVVLPKDLPIGDYEVSVRSQPSGSATESNLGLNIPRRSVLRWHFQLEATAADGYVLPMMTDFDDDGLRELSAMIFGEGTYGATSFFELPAMGLGSDLLLPVHTSSRLFIPWSVHDLDVDGVPELMAVDAERVRLLEAGDGTARFPDTVIWAQDDVWGGATGDLDADGRREMYLRSSRGPLFRTYEHAGTDNDFTQVAVNTNPTDGPNNLGERQVVGDFDADGRGDLLVGDEDGDLIVFESIGDDTLDPVWVVDNERDDEDSRVVGGGVDLDGDGQIEFAVGRLLTDRFNPDRTQWSVTIYEHGGGDNEYEVEHELLVGGGKSQGNGISMGDLDGDGLVELCVALVPDMYIVRPIGPDEYEPVWHTPIRDSHRPLLGDLDGDGITEIAYNSTAGAIEIISLADARVLQLEAPAGFAAIGDGPDRVTLSWEPVDGVTVYRLYRAPVAEPLVLLASVGETSFVDMTVEEGVTYTYSVAAIGSDDFEGRRSTPQSATPASLPALLRIDRLTSRHLALDFSGPMGPSVEEGFRYQVLPGIGSPTSATRDRGGSHVILAFGSLPESGRYELTATDLRAESGARLEQGRLSFLFDLEAVESRPQLVHAEIEQRTRLVLRFNAPLQSPLPASGITIDAGSITVEEVTALTQSEVAVTLADDTPLQPWGRRYEVVISGWRDESGAGVSGRTFVQWAPSELGAHVVFPNPFDPSLGNLVFGGLPAGSRVSIFSMAGGLLRTLHEEQGAGGVEWDGSNETGALAGSGLYYYRVSHGGIVQTGSFAVIRR